MTSPLRISSLSLLRLVDSRSMRSVRREIRGTCNYGGRSGNFSGRGEIDSGLEKVTTMVDVRGQVLALKADAKSARDDGDWDGAMRDLQEAIDLILDHRAESRPALPSWLPSELADAYGLIGGVEKRRGLEAHGEERQRYLEASLAAYDEGFSYERDLPPNDANTYNRVNRLVGRVLLDPRVLQQDDEFSQDLRTAEEVLIKQTGTARNKD